MNRIFLSIAFTAMALGTWSLPAQASTEKIAVVIGNNLGHNPTRKLQYAEDDAVKIGGVLTQLGGFESHNVHVLLGQNAGEVKRALANIERLLDAVKTEKALLVLYYSGHAEDGKLELGSSALSFEFLRSYLERSPADVRLAFLDSCESGALIREKGGARSDGFRIAVNDDFSSKGYAIITSSAVDELSQESEEIRGSVFTHYLVSALRGAGDSTGDGRVTLEEAYHFVYGRTLARTSRSRAGSQHPMYHFQLEGRGNIVLTTPETKGALLAISPPAAGRVLILEEKNDSIVAEIDVRAESTNQLAVASGQYRAYLIDDNQNVSMARVRLNDTEHGILEPNEFQPVQLEESVTKGGLFLARRPEWRKEISAGGMWRLFPLDDAINSWGASLSYRMISKSGFTPVLRLSWASRGDMGDSSGYNDLGAQVGMGYHFQIATHWSANLDLLAGGGVLWQSNTGGERRYTSTVGYLGQGELLYTHNQFLAGLQAGAGGRVFKLREDGWTYAPDIVAGIFLGYAWGRL